MKNELIEKISKSLLDNENYLSINETCISYDWKFKILDVLNSYYIKENKEHFIYVSCSCTYTDKNNNITNSVEDFKIQIGLTTSKGYFSSKELPIKFQDSDNLTDIELLNALNYYNKESKKNTFDPFFYENQIRRNNASAWSCIANKHLQEDCR